MALNARSRNIESLFELHAWSTAHIRNLWVERQHQLTPAQLMGRDDADELGALAILDEIESQPDGLYKRDKSGAIVKENKNMVKASDYSSREEFEAARKAIREERKKTGGK